MPGPFPSKNLSLSLGVDLIPRFFQLLQQGFQVKVVLGCSVRDLLCREFRLSPEYLEKGIQTIFLDGRPVDDLDSATVNEGATLALSAAMPGLAGATLRRGGYYASMRGGITHGQKNGRQRPLEGLICVKLYNLVLRKLGPLFLQRGVLIKGKDLEDFLKGQGSDFREGCKESRAEGNKGAPRLLSQMKWGDNYVFLRLKAG